jgi:glyoxylase-like metal-dependent hydrolase (beta-lactamase superfamily II)
MIEEIMNNFYRIEIPLPLPELQSVNCYIIKGPERNLMIDTGMDDHVCKQAMVTALKELEVDLKQTDFFITHCHIDHFGLVASLIRNGSTVYINRLEADIVHKVRSGAIVSDWTMFLETSGFPENKIENIFSPEGAKPYRTENPLPFLYLEDEDSLSFGDYHFACVETPGHTNGHMCLYEPQSKVFVAGDHLLNDITPGIHGFTNENPLKSYLSSLDKIAALDICLVLPGHRGLFKNCTDRIEELKAHHKERAREVVSILRESPKDAFNVASQMTWDVDCDSWQVFPVQQKFFATGEAFAHLRFLEEEGTITREIIDNRIIYFAG